MSKQTNVVAARKPKKLKPRFWSLLFVIIFVILLIVAVAGAVALFTPLYNVIIDGFGIDTTAEVSTWSNFFQNLYTYVKEHVASGYGLSLPFWLTGEGAQGDAGTSYIWSLAFILYAYYLIIIAALFFTSLPLFAMGRIKLKKKSSKARLYIFATLNFLIIAFASFCLLVQPWADDYSNYFGWTKQIFTYIEEALFVEGQPLSFLAKNSSESAPYAHSYFASIVFTYLAVCVVSLILQIPSLAGGNKPKAKEKTVPYYEREYSDIPDEEETILPPSTQPVAAIAKEAKEEKTPTAPAQISTPVVVATPAEFKAVEAEMVTKAEVAPTPAAPATAPVVETPKEEIRVSTTEINILNSLEPFKLNPVETLPGYYKTDTDAILNALEPKNLNRVDQTPDEEEVDQRIKKILESLSASQKNEVDILPGIGETGETPWDTKVAPQETRTTSEVAPTPRETPVQQTVAQETAGDEEIKDITIDAQPEATSEPVVEEIVHQELGGDDTSRNAITTKYNDLDEEDKVSNVIKQEEEEEALGESRYDERVTKTETEHEEVYTAAPTTATTRTATEVEEEVTPKAEETTTAKEETVEEVVEAPAVTEAPLDEDETPVVDEEALARKRITPVAPLARQEETVEVKEEKQLTAVSGPLHNIRSARKDIKPVEARKVKFDLQQYRIKTYEGDLSAEEAFTKGVTKVQPVVNPVFINQNQKSDFLQQKREEEVRKSGYTNVTTAKIVKPTHAISSANKPLKKATSIRELVKQKKEDDSTDDNKAE